MSTGKNISTTDHVSNVVNRLRGMTTTQWLGLIAFVGVLTIPYVYNSHQSDKKHRKSEEIKAEIKELRAEYITLKSEIVGQNKQSDVAKRLEHRGLHPIRRAPINLNTIDDD